MKTKEPYNGGKLPEWKLRFIRVNHADMTAAEIAKALDISDCKVYSYCKEQGIRVKLSPWYKDKRKIEKRTLLNTAH